MFPITDARGRVIAFGGRALEKDVPAKYLNSPETPLFHKGDNLYNLATARQAAHDGAQLIVVEGYVDVIAMVTSGFARRRRAARHGAHRKPARAALEDGGRADPLLRRRPRRTEGGVSCRRSRAAASQTRQEPALCAAAGGAGPRRSRALGRARRDRGGDLGRAPARGVCGRARSRAASFATPERRAALEARIGELANAIRDEVVRRYYRQDLAERLHRAFAPNRPAASAAAAVSTPNHVVIHSVLPAPPTGFPQAGQGQVQARLRRHSASGPLPGRQSPARQQPDHARPAHPRSPAGRR